MKGASVAATVIAFALGLAAPAFAVEPATAASAAVAVAAASAAEPASAPATAAAGGVDAYGELRDPALQARFEGLTRQLRCLVCQNESIADSNADLAGDLRRQVREMLLAGRSDQEVLRFMTDRYGEFVRFSPPMEPKTWLIWGAPFVALLVAVIIIVRVARHRARMPVDDEPNAGQT